MSKKRDKNKRMKKQMQKMSDWAKINQIPQTHAIFWRQKAGFYLAGTPEHP